MNHKIECIAFEQKFWIPIMRDHCQFILDSLSPRETKEIKTARSLLEELNQLQAQKEFSLTQEGIKASTKIAKHLRSFKLHIIKRLLTESFAFNLTATFINHMVNEIDEYLRILSYLNRGKLPPPLHPLHHHLLWLPDAAGHAVGLDQKMDGVEKDLKKRTRHFSKRFESYYIKAVELAGFLRTHLQDFPALSRFNREVEWEILLFQGFLNELEELSLNKEAISALDPLLPDHMFREECYYLHKLAQGSNIPTPSCQPFPKC